MKSLFARIRFAILFAAGLAAGFAGCALDMDLPERFAIVYGVADYIGTDFDLDYSDDDAQAMRDLFVRKGFPPGNVILRVDGVANRPQIEADMNTVRDTAGKDSLFVFYFSGHGASMPSSGPEPAPQDAYDEYIYLHSSVSITDGGLSDDELMSLISRIPSRQKVVIIDTCNSGGFIGYSADVDMIPPAYDGSNMTSPLAAAGKAFVKYFANPQYGDIPYTEAIVITAAGEREVSWEAGGFNHGVFTYFLLQSPRGADYNGDGYVTATEAYGYAADGIASVWNDGYMIGYTREEWYFLPRISGGPMDFILFEAD